MIIYLLDKNYFSFVGSVLPKNLTIFLYITFLHWKKYYKVGYIWVITSSKHQKYTLKFGYFYIRLSRNYFRQRLVLFYGKFNVTKCISVNNCRKLRRLNWINTKYFKFSKCEGVEKFNKLTWLLRWWNVTKAMFN